MEIKCADGVEGLLIADMFGEIFFRVYHSPGVFTDYKYRHSDMSVVIKDEDAYFYSDGDRHILDHSPETLGLNR